MDFIGDPGASANGRRVFSASLSLILVDMLANLMFLPTHWNERSRFLRLAKAIL
jgi:hypothetical protein